MRTNTVLSFLFLILVSRKSVRCHLSSLFSVNSADYQLFVQQHNHFYKLISENAKLHDKSMNGDAGDTIGDVSSDSDNRDEVIDDSLKVQNENIADGIADLDVLENDESEGSDDSNDDNPDDEENIRQCLVEDSIHVDNPVSVLRINEETQKENISILLGHVWSEYIQKRPSFDAIQNKLILSDIPRAAALRANGTDHRSFQRQLLAQFTSPLTRSAQRALWLDPEFVLTLRGQLVLATPDANNGNHDNSPEHYNRGLKLSCPSGTSTIVKAIVTALVQSVNADFVIINRRTIDSVRHKAIERYEIRSESISTASIIESLLNFLHGSKIRSVVCLQDEMKWFAHQYGVSQVFIKELQRDYSNIFFLHVDPEPPLVFGYSPAEARAKQQGPSVASLSQDPSTGGNPQFSFPFSPQSFPIADGNRQQPSGKLQSNMKSAHSTGPSPSVFQNANPLNNQIPMTVGQSFQILIKNGSASISPIPSIVPPGAMPPAGLPPGMMSGMMPFTGIVPPGMTPFGMMPPPPPGMMMPPGAMGGNPHAMPNPPDSLMRKIIEHRQKKQREGVSDDELGLTEEDMRVFMSDPSNRAAMQVITGKMLTK